MTLTTFYNTISFSTIFFPFVFLLEYYNKRNMLYLYALFGLLSVNIVSELLKYYVFYNNGRPQGATDCNLYNNNGNQSGAPGMPSSHAAITSYFVFTYIYISKFNTSKTLILLSYLYLVLYSRYYKKCHSVEQLSAGFSLGTVSFVVFYMLIKLGLI